MRGYKMQLSDLEALIDQSKPEDTLFIVSCTKEKIWDDTPNCPEYVKARNSYTSERFLNFLRWMQKNNLEAKGYSWVILSGKYGFIEPSHPITRYNILLGDPNFYGISDYTLKNQAYQKRWWKGNELTLNDFSTIICINCKEEYPKKIELAFSLKDLHFFIFKKGRILELENQQ